MLLVLTPVAAAGHGPGVLAAWLCLGAYMIHQWEEHDGDRFRRYVNDRLGGGREILTPRAILWVNLPLVWGLNVACVLAAAAGSDGWAAPALYLVLVNGLGHAAQAIRFREANPGLWSALLIFVPLGLWGLWATSPSAALHLLGLALSLGLHLLILRDVVFPPKAAP
ncbi:MAG: HXXEE domain-containing protein [Pseudomonadota bacterium]